MQRRRFVKQFSLGSALLASGAISPAALSAYDLIKVTILHTNDVHSRIDPFPMDGGDLQGLGGVARRAAVIQKIREEESNVLLLDAGDIFQGTPYFNYFLGELEFKMMTRMGYDAATIGNHDFDAGIEGLHRQLPHASFPFIICNYDFSDTPMHARTLPYLIIEKEGVKIGITGAGIELEGLVLNKLTGGTKYENPIEKVNQICRFLKKEEKCHFIICLSHLGFRYEHNKVSDVILAENSEDLDLILGGHTHTFLNEPVKVLNKKGRPVTINQVGWGGVLLGRLEVVFERNFRRKCIHCNNQMIR